MAVIAFIVMVFTALVMMFLPAFMALLAVPSAAAAVPFLGEGLGSILVPLLAIRDAQRVGQVQGVGKPLGHEKGTPQ